MITQGVTEMLFIFNGGGSDATLTGLTHPRAFGNPFPHSLGADIVPVSVS